jgi:hypothetical protein
MDQELIPQQRHHNVLHGIGWRLAVGASTLVAAFGAQTVDAQTPPVEGPAPNPVTKTDEAACQQAVVGSGEHLGSILEAAQIKYSVGSKTVQATLKFGKMEVAGEDGSLVDCTDIMASKFEFDMVAKRPKAQSTPRAAEGSSKSKNVVKHFGKKAVWPKTQTTAVSRVSQAGGGADGGTLKVKYTLPHKLTKQEVAKKTYGLSEKATSGPAPGVEADGLATVTRGKIMWLKKADVAGLKKDSSSHPSSGNTSVSTVIPGKVYPISALHKQVEKLRKKCDEDTLSVTSGAKSHDDDRYGDTLKIAELPQADGENHTQIDLALSASRRICGSILFVSHNDTYSGTAVIFGSFTKAGTWLDSIPDSVYGSARGLSIFTEAK